MNKDGDQQLCRKLALQCFSLLHQQAKNDTQVTIVPEASETSDPNFDANSWNGLDSLMRKELTNRWTRLKDKFITDVTNCPDRLLRTTLSRYILRLAIEKQLLKEKPFVATCFSVTESHLMSYETVNFSDSNTGKRRWIPLLVLASSGNSKVLCIVDPIQEAFDLVAWGERVLGHCVSFAVAKEAEELEPHSVAGKHIIYTSPTTYLSYLTNYGLLSAFTHVFVSDVGATRFSYLSPQVHLSKHKFRPPIQTLTCGTWGYCSVNFIGVRYDPWSYKERKFSGLNMSFEDYPKKLILAILKLHQSIEKPGGILVFVPSPGDCHFLRDYLDNMDVKREFNILVFHQYLPENQTYFANNDFTKRTVIFAHHHTECRKTFDGISCIVDTNIDQEIGYYPKVRNSLLCHEPKKTKREKLCYAREDLRYYVLPTSKRYGLQFPFLFPPRERTADMLWWFMRNKGHFEAQQFDPVFENDVVDKFLKDNKFYNIEMKYKTTLHTIIKYVDHWGFKLITKCLCENPEIILLAVQFAVIVSLPPMSFWNGLINSKTKVQCVSTYGDVFNTIALYHSWQRNMYSVPSQSHDVMMQYIEVTVGKIVRIIRSVGVTVSGNSSDISEQLVDRIIVKLISISETYETSGYDDSSNVTAITIDKQPVSLHEGSVVKMNFQKALINCFVLDPKKGEKYTATQITPLCYSKSYKYKPEADFQEKYYKLSMDFAVECLLRFQKSILKKLSENNVIGDYVRKIEDVIALMKMYISNLRDSPIECLRIHLKEIIPKLKAYWMLSEESPDLLVNLFEIKSMIEQNRVVHIKMSACLTLLKWLTYVVASSSAATKIVLVLKSATDCEAISLYLNMTLEKYFGIKAVAENIRFGPHLRNYTVVLTTPLVFMCEAMEGRYLDGFTHFLTDDYLYDSATLELAKLMASPDGLFPSMKVILMGVSTFIRRVPYIELHNCYKYGVLRVECTEYNLVERVTSAVVETLQHHLNINIQVNLPTIADCKACVSVLLEVKKMNNVTIACLYDYVSLKADLIFKSEGRNKILFVCNDGRHKYTYPGITHVIDPGVLFESFFDLSMGCNIAKIYRSDEFMEMDNNEDVSNGEPLSLETQCNNDIKLVWKMKNCMIIADYLKSLGRTKCATSNSLSGVYNRHTLNQIFGWPSDDAYFPRDVRLLSYLDVDLLAYVLDCYTHEDFVFLLALRLSAILMYPISYWCSDDSIPISQPQQHGDSFSLLYLYTEYNSMANNKLASSCLEVFKYIDCIERNVYGLLKGYQLPKVSKFSESNIEMVKKIYFNHFPRVNSLPKFIHNYEINCNLRGKVLKDEEVFGLIKQQDSYFSFNWLVVKNRKICLCNVVEKCSEVHQFEDDVVYDAVDVRSVGPFDSVLLKNIINEPEFETYMGDLKKQHNCGEVRISCESETGHVDLFFPTSVGKKQRDLFTSGLQSAVDKMLKTKISLTKVVVIAQYMKVIFKRGGDIQDISFISLRDILAKKGIHFENPDQLPLFIVPQHFIRLDRIDLITQIEAFISRVAKLESHLEIIYVGNLRLLKVHSTSVKDTYKLWHLILKYFKGREIFLTKDQEYILRSKFGVSKLKMISKEEKTLIYFDRCLSSLHIVGDSISSSRAVTQIKKYLDTFPKSTLHLSLLEEGYPNSILHSLLSRYGTHLNDLSQSCKCLMVDLDVKEKTIFALGTQDSLTKLRIRTQTLPLPDKALTLDGFDPKETCAACSIPLTATQKSYRLLACKHSYCSLCMEAFIYSVYRRNSLPAVCLFKDCQESLSIYDIERISYVYDLSDLFYKAYPLYLERNTNFQQCPNITCLGIIDPANKTCPVCNYEKCNRCDLLKHSPFGCDDAKE